jgi:uracil-DNA glycosylase
MPAARSTDRLIIIGEAPSRTGDPDRPLMSAPIRRRLIELLGIDDAAYFAIDRINLLRAWPGRRGKKGDLADPIAMRSAAWIVLAAEELIGRRAVFLGARVARAFGAHRRPILRWFAIGGGSAAILPHPSGVNRWWNDPRNRRRAIRFMRKIGRELLR